MKTQLSKAARSKARYSEDYKKEALKLWRNSGRSAVRSSLIKKRVQHRNPREP